MLAGGRKERDSRVRLLACLRFFQTWVAYEQLNYEARMEEETVHSYIQHFTKDMCNIYRQQFLNRSPTKAEME